MKRFLAMMTLIGVLGLAPPLPAPASTPAAVVRTTAAVQAAPAPQDPVAGYESREAQSADLETFAGGKDEVIHISICVVVLVVLLLILL